MALPVGLAHTEFGDSPSVFGWDTVPWDASGYGAHHLLFGASLTRAMMGKELVAILVLSERLRCRDNSTIETFSFQLQTKLALPRRI